MDIRPRMNEMKNQTKQVNKKQSLNRAVLGLGVILATVAPAFAEDAAGVSIDLTTGLAGVAIIGGILAAGSLKALPTYAAWGIKKALSMLR